MIKRIFAILIILHSLQIRSNAQNTGVSLTTKSDLGMILPTLETLIDSAIEHNPYVQFRDLQITVNECKKRTNKVEWTRNLGLQSNIGYGNLFNSSLNYVDGTVPVGLKTNRSETHYSAAAYINMPFSTIANRKNLTKMAEAELEQARQMAEMQRNEVRELVINRYNEVLLRHKLLRIRANYHQTTSTALQMAEKEFLNGIIPITEYTRLTEISTKAESDYEIAKTDFFTSYMLLEEIAGFKLINPQINTGENDNN